MQNINLGLFHFKLLFEIMHNLHIIENETDLVNYVVEKLVKSLNTEGGSIFKLISETKLMPVAAIGADLEALKKIEFEVGKGVVGWCIQERQPVKVENPLNDPRFYKDVDLSTGFTTKSIIAVPIVYKQKIIGALELLNRKGGPFVPQDLEFVAMVGKELGIAIENIALVKSIEYKEMFQEALINSLSSGLIVVDATGVLVDINPYAMGLLQIPEINIQENEHFTDALKDCCQDFIVLIEQIKKIDKPAVRREILLIIGGEKKLIGYTGVPIKDKKNNNIGAAILFQDITHLMRS